MARAPVTLAPVTRVALAHGLSTRVEPLASPLGADSWAMAFGECQTHGLGGLLVAAVADGAVPVTDEQRAEVARLEVVLTRARMQAERNVLEVVAVLDDAGIETRLLKGLAFATLEYPDAQWRPTGDVDLLVRGEEIERAVEVLVARGGEILEPDPVPGYRATVGKGTPVRLASPATEVDLHRLLVWGPLGVRQPPDGPWSTARSFELQGRELTTLGVEETLLHASYHLLIGGRPRALSVRDVAQVLADPDLDPDRVVALARHWGATAVTTTAVKRAVADLALVDAGPLARWARHQPITRRDALWLRIHAPDGAVVGLESLATYVELRTPIERQMLRAATRHPVAGSWSDPRTRVVDAVRRLVART